MLRLPLVVLVALAALYGAAQADSDIDWKNGKLGHLSKYIGTYHFDTVLNDPAVAARLLRLLGRNGVVELKDRLQVQAPIDFVDTAIVLRGLMPHEGGSDEAIVSVTPYDGMVEAAMLIDGNKVLATPGYFTTEDGWDAVYIQANNWGQEVHAKVQPFMHDPH